MEYLVIISFAITLAVIASKIKSNAEKRKTMFIYMRSLSEYLLVVEKNPYIGERKRIGDHAALLFNQLRSGYIKSAEAKLLVEDNGTPKIYSEQRFLIPNSVLNSLSDAVMEPDTEKRYTACITVLNGLTENMATVYERLLGKEFINNFFSNIQPVLSYSDDDNDRKEYAFVRTLPLPDKCDPVFEECCGRAMIEIAKENSHTSFGEKMKEHKDVCILFACGLAAAAVSVLLLYFSDSFYIDGISHLRRYIWIMGYPGGLDIRPAAVIVGAAGVLFTGISMGLFSVSLAVAMEPDSDRVSLCKLTIKKYLPVIVPVMVCISSYISLPVRSMFWTDIWGEDFVIYADQLFGCISPILLCFSLIFIMLFGISDVLEIKWLSVLATTVSIVIGIFAFSMGAGIWTMI